MEINQQMNLKKGLMFLKSGKRGTKGRLITRITKMIL